jgi:hypothetical protein
MAIAQTHMNKVKIDANISIARAKARQAQVSANAHVLKAKQFISRAKPQGEQH